MGDCPRSLASGSSAAFKTIPDIVPTQLWHERQEGQDYERGWGQGTPKASGSPQQGCELYFPGGLGQPSRLGARSSCGPREAAGSEGIQTALSHPLPQQLALCKNPRLQSNPFSFLLSFTCPSSLLFSPFLSKLIINRSRQK